MCCKLTTKSCTYYCKTMHIVDCILTIKSYSMHAVDGTHPVEAHICASTGCVVMIYTQRWAKSSYVYDFKIKIKSPK